MNFFIQIFEFLNQHDPNQGSINFDWNGPSRLVK